MEVILLERIANLGDLGAKVRVRPGFGRNDLIPKGRALPCTKDNLARFEQQRAELEKAANERLIAAKKRAESLEGLAFSISANASDEGKLFGSVGAHEIVQAVVEKGHTLAKSEVQLPLGPFRQLGEYEVDLYLHGSDIIAKIKVSIVSA